MIRSLPPRRHLALALALAVSALFLLPNLGDPVMNREQELRVALTARTMVESGNWLVPQYLGEPRLRKPPLMYWITAGVYRLAGATDSAALARLPSALSGLALAGLIYAIGAHLMGRRRGLLAALVCTSSFIVLRQARLAETDIPLTLFTTLSLYAGYRALHATRATRWWLLAGASAGLGFLTKGPAAVILPLLAWVAFAVLPLHRRRRRWNAGPACALLVCLLLALPWYGFLLLQVSGSAETQLSRELSATFAETKHPGPVYYYVYTLLHAGAPWSLALPFAIWHLGRSRRGHAVSWMLLAWFTTSFLALSATSSKQIHYATLLIPPSSLAIAWLLGFAHRRGAAPRARMARRIFAALSVLLAVSAAALAVHVLREAGFEGRVETLALACAAGLAALASLFRPRVLPGTAGIIAALLGLHAALAHHVMPQQNDQRVIAETLRAARLDVRTAPRIFASGAARPIFEFYACRTVIPADSPEDAWRRAADGDVLVSVSPSAAGKAPREAAGELLAEGHRGSLRCVVQRKR